MRCVRPGCENMLKPTQLSHCSTACWIEDKTRPSAYAPEDRSDKSCANCGVVQEYEYFTIERRLPWGLNGWCNRCWERQRQLAWNEFRKAMRAFKRPTQCSSCRRNYDTVQPATKISGHHLNYHYPFFVVWLCQTCHGRAHRREEKLVRELRAAGQEPPVYVPPQVAELDRIAREYDETHSAQTQPAHAGGRHEGLLRGHASRYNGAG